MKQEQVEQERDTVATAIRADLSTGDAGYRAAGEKFLKKKENLPHGAWLPWLEKNGFEERQARRLIEFAKSDVDVRFTDICNPKRKDVLEDDSEQDESSEDNDSISEGPLEIDICFSHFVEATKEHPAEQYLEDIREKLVRKGNRTRFSSALITARTWIDEVLVGIEQLNHGDNK